MDDVGIDQMKVFGYGGTTGPNLPNIDAVAHAGVRFRNTWSMPECSPGRASFFVGRYPLRTGINQAIGPNDLATSQLSPYDARSEEHTSELQSLMRISYAVFCLKKKIQHHNINHTPIQTTQNT